MFIAFSPSVTPAACHLLPSCGIPILFMRLGAPHKIDRCANRCSLYPPQAAVAYVAQRGSGMFNINFNLMTPDNKYISVNHFGGSKPPPYAERGDLRRIKGIKNGHFAKVPVK